MRGALINKKNITILNMILPILAGVAIYMLISPSVYFITILKSVTGYKANGISLQRVPFFAELIRYYLPDMLWEYSLIFALFLAFGRKHILPVLITALIFSVSLECMQMIPSVPGSFDIFDIGVETAAGLFAVFIIKKFTWEDKQYET